MSFKKLGIALSGGGGKGAYQIGVWKALRDFQLDTQIAAISGSSVGGLNGAMLAQGKYEKAESMWLNIESRNMLTLQDVHWLASRLAVLGTTGVISPMLMGFIKTKGLFKQEGLQSMIDEGLDADFLVNSGIPLTVALHHVEGNHVVYHPVREARTASAALLATAALPEIFENVTIDGVSYTDGGFYWNLPHKNVDNTPIKPLVEAGCDTIIAVCLSQNDLSMTPHQFAGVRVLPIVPRRQLGGLSATLDFSNEGSARRMEQGYSDAVYLFEHLDMFLRNEEQYKTLWQRVAAGADVEKSFRSDYRRVDQRHVETVSEMADFDRIVASDDFTQKIELPENDLSSGPLAVLALDNAALLSDLARQDIETCVDGFLTQNQNNQQAVEATVLDALAALSPVQGRADDQCEQGILSRVWGAITGNNQKLAAENDHALAQAQFAALRLIAAVQEKGAISLEFTCVLQNRVNGAFREIERQGQRHNQDLQRVYRSLAGAYTQLRNRLMQHETRLDALERKTGMHHWLLHHNQTRHQGQHLAALPVPLRLACLANDFFHLTQGAWQVEELISLKEMCIKVGLDDNHPVRVADFLTTLLDNKDNVQTLMHRLAEQDDTPAPRIAAAQWLRHVRNHALSETVDTANALSCWHHAPDTTLPGWDFLTELLYCMKAAGFIPLQHSEMGQLKTAWKQQLDTLTQLLHENILPKAFGSEIKALQDAIDGFKLAVPLVGKFSVGKSTLLNAWLGKDIQQEDLNPSTGLATEFHFAEAGQEKMVVHWQPCTPASAVERQDYPLSRYADLLAGKLSANHEALFIELHCNLPILNQHPDLILVDTPGLGSNMDRHNQALQQYLGEGVAFILCINRASHVGKEELAFVRRQRALGQTFSLLVCQEHLSNASEREAMRCTAKAQAGLDADQLVRGCSAREGDLAGFEDILAHIEQQKAGLFQSRMAPKVQALIKQAERLIRQQLSASTNADELRDKKTLIAKAMTQLQASYAQEKYELLRDCTGVIKRQVMAHVGAFMRGRREVYTSQLLAKQSIASLLVADAQNAFQLAAEKSLSPRLKEASQTLGKHAQLESLRPIDLRVDNDNVMAAGSSGMGGTAAGTATGATIGSIVPLIGTAIGAAAGGILGYFFSKSNAKNDAEAQVHQAIEAVITQLQDKAGQVLEDHASKFLAAVLVQIEAQLETEKQNLATIEQQLQADAQQKTAIEQKAQAALNAVRQLLTQPNPAITQ